MRPQLGENCVKDTTEEECEYTCSGPSFQRFVENADFISVILITLHTVSVILILIGRLTRLLLQ